MEEKNFNQEPTIAPSPDVSDKPQKGKKIKIFATIFFCLIVIGGVVYYVYSSGKYSKKANSSISENNHNMNSSNEALDGGNINSNGRIDSGSKTTSASADINTEILQMDKTMNGLNDETDLGDNTLSDSQIGL